VPIGSLQGRRQAASGPLDGRENWLFLADMSERELSPAAKRALSEAEQRRAAIDDAAAKLPPEQPAKRAKEPSRYGDWEKNGIASDF
jgi:hypothetical protein